MGAWVHSALYHLCEACCSALISILRVLRRHLYCMSPLYSCTSYDDYLAPAVLCKRPVRHAAGPPWPVSYQLRGACFTMQVQTQIGPTQKSIAPQPCTMGSDWYQPCGRSLDPRCTTLPSAVVRCADGTSLEYGKVLRRRCLHCSGLACRSLAISFSSRPQNRETHFPARWLLASLIGLPRRCFRERQKSHERTRRILQRPSGIKH